MCAYILSMNMCSDMFNFWYIIWVTCIPSGSFFCWGTGTRHRSFFETRVSPVYTLRLSHLLTNIDHQRSLRQFIYQHMTTSRPNGLQTVCIFSLATSMFVIESIRNQDWNLTIDLGPFLFFPKRIHLIFLFTSEYNMIQRDGRMGWQWKKEKESKVSGSKEENLFTGSKRNDVCKVRKW